MPHTPDIVRILGEARRERREKIYNKLVEGRAPLFDACDRIDDLEEALRGIREQLLKGNTPRISKIIDNVLPQPKEGT